MASTLATTANSLGTILNRALLGPLATYLQVVSFGSVVRQLPVVLRRTNPTQTTNPFIPAGVQGVSEQQVLATAAASSGVAQSPAAPLGATFLGQLPDDAKANTILRATAVAGTSTPQSLIIDPQSTTDPLYASGGALVPTTLHIGIGPTGDILTLGTDAWTSLDVTYVPEHQDVAVYTLPVVPGTGVCTLPAAITTATVPGQPGPVINLLEAVVLTGTVTGNFVVTTPSAAIPGTTKQVCLTLAKTALQFKVSDAVSSVSVKLGLCSAVNINALLETVAPVI